MNIKLMYRGVEFTPTQVLALWDTCPDFRARVKAIYLDTKKWVYLEECEGSQLTVFANV